MRSTFVGSLVWLLTVFTSATANAEESRSSRYESLGPYPVGVRTLVLVDESREDPTTGGPRTLLTEVWYPAVDEARGGDSTAFAEFFGKHRDAARQFASHFGGELEEVNDRFRSIGVRDAKKRKGRFPLLVFSHGNGGVRHQNVFQVDHLASHGYVVVSADHTGNAGVTALPGGVVPYDRRGRGRSGRDRPADVSFLIDEVSKLAAAKNGWLAGGLDEKKIGVFGHSFGGFTACKVAASDDRIGAILPMTVAYGKRLRIPVMVMLGSRDATMHNAGNTVARAYYEASAGPRYLVELKRGGHFSFTDMDHIDPQFGDGIGSDKKGRPYLDTRTAKRWINGYSLAFFDRYVRGDATADAYLSKNQNEQELILRSAGRHTALTKLATQAAPAKKATAQDKPAPVRVLIVTGDDVPAHNWRETTAQTRAFLEAAGVSVRVSEDARILETLSNDRYDVVLLNYRNPPPRDPGEKSRAKLAEFVRNGGGLVVVHFGIFAFPTWKEYREIIGRVWVGRLSGKKISGHPPRGPFEVKVLDSQHAITKGLSDFVADDELYSKLQGEAPIHVLADAHSSYTDSRQPVAWTRPYGTGRVFVTILGHDVRARANPAFQKLITGAAAWAAKRD